jgi:nitroreductase
LVKKRQSTRSFSDKPVEREKLVEIVDAARLSPSACNSQPWKVIVAAEDKKIVTEVAESVALLGINKYFANAPVFFVVLEEHAKLNRSIAQIVDSQIWAPGDLGGFTLTLCYAAEELGLGTCVIGLFDRPRLREALGLPLHAKIKLIVAAGYPSTENVRHKERKTLEEIATFV